MRAIRFDRGNVTYWDLGPVTIRWGIVSRRLAIYVGRRRYLVKRGLPTEVWIARARQLQVNNEHGESV